MATHVRQSGPFLPEWLSRRAKDMPGGLALVAGAGPQALRWTWRDLDCRADALARKMEGLGIAAGDRVAVLLPNSPEYVTAVHALIRLRAVLVPLNVRLATDEIIWQLQNCRARLLIFEARTATQAEEVRIVLPDLAGLLLEEDTQPQVSMPSASAWQAGTPSALAQRVGTPFTSIRDAGVPRNAGIPNDCGPIVPKGKDDREDWPEDTPDTIGGDARLDLSAVHSIVYTSGTSGRPKGALLTYGNHWWNAVGSVLNLGLASRDRWLVCLPLFHVGGLSILMRSVIYGIPVVLPDYDKSAPDSRSGFDPVAVNRAIVEEGVTIVSVVSAMVPRLLEARGDGGYPLGFRCLLLGGGPAPGPLLEECGRRGIPVVQTYGLTETASQCVTLAPADALRKLGSAGRPLLPNEIRIVPIQEDLERDDAVAKGGGTIDSPGLAVPHNRAAAVSETVSQPGEIQVRGPSVTVGYLPDDGNLDVPVPATDADGWLHTGDLGYLDQEGYLYVLDRRTDLIISGGENVYPAEVESVLQSHPQIVEAGVYGVPNKRWGQRVVAAIVARPGVVLDHQAIVVFCRDRLASYKVPTGIHMVEALPRNAAGKLLRRRLREIGE